MFAVMSAVACDSSQEEGPGSHSQVRGEGGRSGPPRPHVVFLIIDTLRADALGCYGDARQASPELDFLARQGVRFQRVISQSSWTRPSIGSLLTSRYPRSLGIRTIRRGALALAEETLAESLSGAGYRTVGATANPHLNPVFGFDQGFDEYLESSTVWNFMEEEELEEELAPGANSRLVTARQLFHRVLSRLHQETPEQLQQPHFLQLDVMDVHEHYPTNQVVRPEFRRLFANLRRSPAKQIYRQALRQVSADFGWFLAELRKLSGFEDVLVVVVSDHGEGLDSHPDVPLSKGHGHLLYESQVGVPWILHHTGSLLTRGQVVEQPVRLLDVMPTLLDLLQIEGPEGMQGTSVWRTMQTGEVADLPKAFAVETYGFGKNKIGLIGATWSYIENRDQAEGLPEHELQPLGLQNGFQTDQAAAHPDLVREFQDMLSQWEEAHPTTPPHDLIGAAAEDTFELLKALGYTDG